MPSAFDVLSKDHEEVKKMLSELEQGPTAASGATANELALRKKMAEQLVIEESRHEAAEEMYFWPAVREHVPGGVRLADEATAQEQEGKQILDKLDKLEADDAQFEQVLGQFIKDGRDHIAFEETQVWPGLRQALSADQAQQLGDDLELAKKAAPTRPHPHTPPSSGIQKAAGPAAAVADAARDAASGRGE